MSMKQNCLGMIEITDKMVDAAISVHNGEGLEGFFAWEVFRQNPSNRKDVLIIRQRMRSYFEAALPFICDAYLEKVKEALADYSPRSARIDVMKAIESLKSDQNINSDSDHAHFKLYPPLTDIQIEKIGLLAEKEIND